MIALVVSLKVKPDQRQRFLEAAEHDSTHSVSDEPGCLRFDVVQDQKDENHFFFYEVYTDAAAIDAHTKAPHYAVWAAAREVVLAEPTDARRSDVLFPRDYK